MSKITNDRLTRSGTGCRNGNSGHQRLNIQLTLRSTDSMIKPTEKDGSICTTVERLRRDRSEAYHRRQPPLCSRRSCSLAKTWDLSLPSPSPGGTTTNTVQSWLHKTLTQNSA